MFKPLFLKSALPLEVRVFGQESVAVVEACGVRAGGRLAKRRGLRSSGVPLQERPPTSGAASSREARELSPKTFFSVRCADLPALSGAVEVYRGPARGWICTRVSDMASGENPGRSPLPLGPALEKSPKLEALASQTLLPPWML